MLIPGIPLPEKSQKECGLNWIRDAMCLHIMEFPKVLFKKKI